MTKGVIAIIEFVTAVLILLVSVGIMFPTLSVNNKFNDAILQLLGRDTFQAMEGLGKVYEFSYNSSSMQNFLSQVLPSDLQRGWTTEGRIRNTITVACNCTISQLTFLQNGFSNLMINNRSLTVQFLSTTLDDIVSSDALLIYNYSALSLYSPGCPSNQITSQCLLNPYETKLLTYLSNGNGIVLIGDISNANATNDLAWQHIFGMAVTKGKIITNTFQGNISFFDQFRKTPSSVSEDMYVPWKFFYHIPIPVAATTLRSFATPPLDPAATGLPIITCSSGWMEGNFSIQATPPPASPGNPINYTFWISQCGDNQMYIQTDSNNGGKADANLTEGGIFTIPNSYSFAFPNQPWNFKINYLRTSMVWISFQPNYQFFDFLAYETGCFNTNPPAGKLSKKSGSGNIPPGWCKGSSPWAGFFTIAPAAGEVFRTLINSNTSTEFNETLPAVVLNGSSTSRAVWSADFTKRGVGDDERLLLISLVLWSANNQATATLTGNPKIQQSVSYIDTREYDMYEVYKFIIGLAFPF